MSESKHAGEALTVEDLIEASLRGPVQLTLDGLYTETIKLRRAIRVLALELDRLRAEKT